MNRVKAVEMLWEAVEFDGLMWGRTYTITGHMFSNGLVMVDDHGYDCFYAKPEDVEANGGDCILSYHTNFELTDFTRKDLAQQWGDYIRSYDVDLNDEGESQTYMKFKEVIYS